jgi:hypothetical protein
MHHPLRRVSALAAAALAAGALTLTTTDAASAAPAPTDPAPYAAAKAWLLQQVQSGLVAGDPGATADAVLQLHLAGDDGDAHTLAEALVPQVDAYAGTADTTNVTSLGAVVTALETAGIDATDVAGVDELSRIASHVDDADGHLSDSSWDNGDIWTQAYAVEALALGVEAGDSSVEAALTAATDYLVGQQCYGGGFAYAYSTGTLCDPSEYNTADTNTTALVVNALLAAQAAGQSVSDALDGAKGWLLATQQSTGAWSYPGDASAPDADSTGVSGEALAQLGETAAANKAAVWERTMQVANVGACAPFATADTGAVAFDAPALTGARTTPIDSTTLVNWLYQVRDGLALLTHAPAGGTLGIAGPAGAQRPGSKVTYTISGAAPGETICVTAPGAAAQAVTANANGAGTVTLALPTSGTGYAVTATSASTTATVGTMIAQPAPQAPAPAPTVKTPKKAHVGAKVKLVVHGLTPGEKVKVSVRGKKVGHGKAKANGTFKVKFKLKGRKLTKLGKAKVKVVDLTSGVVATTKIKVVR